MTTVQRNSSFVWMGVLAAVTLVGSYGLACVFPFSALAAVAALTLDWRKGAFLVLSVWLANQIVGFTMLSYPHETQAYVWGAAIFAAAISAFGVAKLQVGPAPVLRSWRAPVALLASVATYQTIMFAAAVALDGLASSTAEIVAQVALNDALWFAGLVTLKVILERVQVTSSGRTRFAS